MVIIFCLLCVFMQVESFFKFNIKCGLFLINRQEKVEDVVQIRNFVFQFKFLFEFVENGLEVVCSFMEEGIMNIIEKGVVFKKFFFQLCVCLVLWLMKGWVVDVLSGVGQLVRCWVGVVVWIVVLLSWWRICIMCRVSWCVLIVVVWLLRVFLLLFIVMRVIFEVFLLVFLEFWGQFGVGRCGFWSFLFFGFFYVMCIFKQGRR